MARRVWPGEDAVGRRIFLGSDEVTVIGVAGTARFRSLTTDLTAPGVEPDVYFAMSQMGGIDLEIAVRSRTEALPSAEAIRAAVAGIDPSLALHTVRPLAELVRARSSSARFGSSVLGALAVAALFLAGIGVYGVLAFVVGLSRREIAIRMALGADTRGVVALVVRNGMALAVAGVALGVVLALLGARSLAEQLVGVTPRDVPTIAGTAAAVLVVALVAAIVPARSAARVDPHVALTAE